MERERKYSERKSGKKRGQTGEEGASPVFPRFLPLFRSLYFRYSVNPSTEQILFHLKDAKSNLTTAQQRRLDLLLLSAKQYIYACKIALKTPNVTELQRKTETQRKIENVFQLQ